MATKNTATTTEAKATMPWKEAEEKAQQAREKARENVAAQFGPEATPKAPAKAKAAAKPKAAPKTPAKPKAAPKAPAKPKAPAAPKPPKQVTPKAPAMNAPQGASPQEQAAQRTKDIVWRTQAIQDTRLDSLLEQMKKAREAGMLDAAALAAQMATFGEFAGVAGEILSLVQEVVEEAKG